MTTTTLSMAWERGIGYVAFIAIVLGLVAVDRIRAVDYVAAKSAAVRECEGIDPAAYQSGLYFNPDGYRSYYVQSECFQRAAVQFRDESLCARVRQRRSVFASSWGYSPEQCRKLVAEGIAADLSILDEIKRRYAQGAVEVRTFHIERNGNGRDFDIVPVFSGSYGHGYVLTFEILDATPMGAPVLVHSSGYYVDSTSKLRIYVRQADIRDRFPGFALNRPYQVRATALLDVGTGGQAGYWSQVFIERVFPINQRSRSITMRAVF